MSERLEVTEFCPGVDIYRVYDERTGRPATAGYYEIATQAFHKFVNDERGVQRKVNGKPLGGFGIQENAFRDFTGRGCKVIYVHYAPTGIMHKSKPLLWKTKGLMGYYAGEQRFLGILTLKATKMLDDAEKGKRILNASELEQCNTEGRQMVTSIGFTPDWLLTAPDAL